VLATPTDRFVAEDSILTRRWRRIDVMAVVDDLDGLKGALMTKNDSIRQSGKKFSAQPRLHQRAPEIQTYGTVNHLLPLELEEPVR
jgi:hypothetical protein